MLGVILIFAKPFATPSANPFANNLAGPNNFAIKKRNAPNSQRFEEPALSTSSSEASGTPRKEGFAEGVANMYRHVEHLYLCIE